jgi:2-amino-4-hydroxy-6-hydroxymethyldihydropteridine diphosphokinase
MLQQAKDEIAHEIGVIEVFSSIYESEPWGFESENMFLNQVIRVKTILSPIDLLDKALKIESRLGRRRGVGEGYVSRSIDIDILFFNDEIIAENRLAVPHPKIPERMFTLVPLTEIDPDFVHPATGKSVKEMLDECPDKLKVYLYQSN